MIEDAPAMTIAATGALLLGGILEAAGFALALLDLRDTRKRFAAYRTRAQVVEPLPAMARARAFSPTVVVDPPPPPEVRLDRLEAQVADLRNDIEAQADAVADRLRNEMAEVAGAANRARQREDAAFAELLEGVLVAGIPLRRIAVGLFLLGLGLQILSNFM